MMALQDSSMWALGFRQSRAEPSPAVVGQVEIPEIEFSIRPKAERRVDTIYNMRHGDNHGRLYR